MTVVELILIGVGLSMDAFAVAVCKGLGAKRLRASHVVVIAAFFGGFQALMPALGWGLGAAFSSVVEPVGHWIAFALLAFVGAKMVWDAVRGGEEDDVASADMLDIRELTALAIATSIDAFAVGVGFAMLDVQIAFACAVIGCTTFCLSVAGVVVGNLFGSRWEKPSAIAGGFVLIALGVKTLVEHLM